MNFNQESRFNVKQTLVTGTGWLGLGEGIRAIVKFIVIAVLSIMLEPADFGIVGMTDVFISLFFIFMEFGLLNAIVQNPNLTTEIISTLFWINLGASLVLIALAILIAPLIGSFYNEARVVSVFSVLALSMLFRAVSVVQRGLMLRNMEFRRLATINSAAISCAGIVAIIVAINNGGYWSLVVLHLINSILMTLGLWLFSPWRPKMVIDLNASLDSIKFSANLLLSNLLSFATFRLDVIIIGRYLGPESLGLYLLGSTLILRPLRQLLNMIGLTLLPVLSALQNNIPKVRETYVNTIYAVFNLGSPFLVIAAIIAPILLTYQLGDKWRLAVPIFVIWCFAGLREILFSRIVIIYLTMGRPDLNWKYQLISLPFLVFSLILGLNWGSVGAALGFTIAQTAMLLFGQYLGLNLISMSIPSYLSRFKYQFIALILIVLVGFPFLSWMTAIGLHPYLITIAITVTSVIIYLSTLYLTDSQVRTFIQQNSYKLASLIRPSSIP